MAAVWHLSRHVVHVVAIALLWKFVGFYAETGDVPGSKLGKIVYDVSSVIRGNDSIHSEILPEDLYVREVNASANYYFLANDAAYDDICWDGLECTLYQIKGISLIFGEKANKIDILAMKDVPLTNTTIPDLLKVDNSPIDSVNILLHESSGCHGVKKINRYLNHELKINRTQKLFKRGVEYSEEFVERCVDEGVPPFDYLDHTILRIPVSPNNTMLSYGIFFEKVHRLIEKNRRLVQQLNPQSTPYILLENDWDATISADNYDKFRALMTTYLDAFSKQNVGNEIFIVSPFLKKAKIVPSDAFFRQKVSVIYQIFDEFGFVTITPHDENILTCSHQRTLNILLSTIQSITVQGPFYKVISLLSTGCKTCSKNAQNHFKAPLNVSINLILEKNRNEPEFDKQVEKILEIIETSRNSSAEIKIEKVYIPAEEFNKRDSMKKAVNLLQFQNIDIGCFGKTFSSKIEIKANIEATIKQCGKLVNFTNEIVQYVAPLIRSRENVLTFLIRLEEEKQNFERLYPGKMLTWSILLKTPDATITSSYCKPEGKQIWEYYQIVYSFANFHGWSILLQSYDPYDSGLWDLVKTNSEMRSLNSKFPVLFRTNAPPSANKELPMTYPCIQKTEDASRSNISFLENLYSGTTFQTNLRASPPLSSAELQTMLDLTMTRFPSVEILAVSQVDFKTVVKVAGSNTPTNRNYEGSKRSVYIEVPLAEVYSLRQDIHTVFQSKHAAIHVTNWESLSGEQLDEWEDVPYSSVIKFGLTVQNCFQWIDNEEDNDKLEKIKSLPFMQHVSYIVCNTSPITPDNIRFNWMDEYLGTLLFTKSYMEYILSIESKTENKIEVMFRLNYVCSKRNKVERFLRFLNDVNQHSAAYKIRYFLVRAFENETSANCSIGWWRPDSYADLSNISTYVNTEDEHAGREARVSPSPPPEQNSYAVYFFIIMPIVVFFLFIILAQWLYQRKQKTRILTQIEVSQFYNGGQKPNPLNAPDCYLDLGNMKFPKEYEIPLKDIETQEIIGSGQFGVVHRGILSKHIEVAIKIPRSDCGKEQFKSTLSELKILCHIGEHPNIVSFLGACTKGIASGNLQIVIEYCKNGCLLQYLRQNQESGDEHEPISSYQMYGFSLQISSGMEYIAEKRVVHGDLAARNVLLTSEWTCKIADFGLSRRLYEMSAYAYVKTSEDPLPWRWMAPESLRNMEFTTKSDVWSYGVTLWEIFSLGMVPYPGLIWTASYVTELENGMRMDKAPHATDDIHAETLECWNLNSDARPTFTELKEYFVGLRNEQYLNLNKV